MSYQGRFQPSFPDKYKGDPTRIVYRSLWERKFMVYCDKNQKILEWSSEENYIWYKSPVDGKAHRYFPDFYIKVKEADGKIKKYIIEIKPQKQCVPPKYPGRQTKKYIREVYEYGKNQSKWEAARDWCLDRGYEFKVITEKELDINT